MLKLLAGSAAALMLGAPAMAAAPTTVVIDGQKVFNESMTATKGGDLIIGGSGTGAVYRAKAGQAKATVWIDATKYGVKSVLGVFAHDASNTLYVCSVSPFGGPPEPALSKMLTFDLKAGGAPKASYPLPNGGQGLCNDVAVSKAGDAFIADTIGGKVLVLKKGGAAIEEWVASPDLRGADGLAFLDNGDLIVNTVTSGRLFKIAPDKKITELTPSLKLGGPDGMRSSGGNRVLQAESGGARITEITINGDKAEMRVVHSEPGVTGVALVGKTVWVNNGKVNYMMDPKLRGQDPGEFSVHAVPLGR
jgi:hypothetical protein